MIERAGKLYYANSVITVHEALHPRLHHSTLCIGNHWDMERHLAELMLTLSSGLWWPLLRDSHGYLVCVEIHFAVGWYVQLNHLNVLLLRKHVECQLVLEQRRAPLPEEDPSLRVRRGAQRGVHVFRAYALLLKLDIVVDGDVRHHGLQLVRGEETPWAGALAKAEGYIVRGRRDVLVLGCVQILLLLVHVAEGVKDSRVFIVLVVKVCRERGRDKDGALRDGRAIGEREGLKRSALNGKWDDTVVPQALTHEAVDSPHLTHRNLRPAFFTNDSLDLFPERGNEFGVGSEVV